MKYIKIISGGQTGADRAGIKFARDHDIPYGGTVPLRRKAEDGVVPMIYDEMRESYSSDYRIRTEQNVKDAFCTLVFTMCPLKEVTSGSWLTIAFARQHNRQWMHVNLKEPNVPMVDEWLDKWYRMWLPNNEHWRGAVQFTINIAGGRESKNPGMEAAVLAFLGQLKFLFTN